MTASAGVTVTGDVTYSGKQSRLDVLEQPSATVRAADFVFGSSGRRGTPARALVDDSNALVVNYAADWPTLNLGGTTIVAQGNLRAAKDLKVDANTVLSGKLDVNGDATLGKLTLDGDTTILNNEPSLKVMRTKGQASGGTKIFLELMQDDANPAAVPEVGPSLRFHHANRFWYRIEARSDGLHVRDGHPESSAYKPLSAGNLFSNNKHVTTGAAERLRIVRGTVTISGSIEAGDGFSVTKVGVVWKITFDVAFAAAPTVVATQQHPDHNLVNDSGNTRDNAVIVGVKTTEVYIKTGDGNGEHSWRRFHFIAIGTF